MVLIAAVGKISAANRFSPLIAAVGEISAANRFSPVAHGDPPHAVSGHPLYGPVMRVPGRFPRHLQISVNRSRNLRLDPGDLLHTWQQLAPPLNKFRAPVPASPSLPPRPNMEGEIAPVGRTWEEYSSIVRQKMMDDISRWRHTLPSGRKYLEAIGLISVQPHPLVLALALLERQQLKDDSKGSLRKFVEAQLGIEATRGVLRRRKKSVHVVAIDGLTDAPHQTPERSARVLLAKIAQWAHANQELVVVPDHALRSADYDLTAYYEQLGFEKVKNTDVGSHLLVYSGAPMTPTDEWIGRRQSMVGLCLYQGT